ncbi:MAG TPA: acetylglutamate kinase [Myxococcales bacterium]|nr:acetylglutamate kinase [Myxococcales bacterium]HIK86665.1 acetylglutamate kinase [Myxococcales bacterium]
MKKLVDNGNDDGREDAPGNARDNIQENAQQKAKILMEALPYMQRLYGKTIVIKYGGHAMTDESLKASFAADVVMLKQIGVRPVIVHGGGPQIAETLKRMGRKSQFIDGRRVTDDETMEVVERVLGGKVNREIVELIGQAGGTAVGYRGSDGGLLRVQKKLIDGQDLGRVGEVIAVDPSVVRDAVESGFIPVVAPIGVDAKGVSHNVNADEAAGALAAALEAEKLMLLTDIEGVLDDKNQLISELSVEECNRLIANGTIKGGMIPKMECCIQALLGNVGRTHIVDGRVLHAVLLEIFSDDAGIGTLLVPSPAGSAG